MDDFIIEYVLVTRKVNGKYYIDIQQGNIIVYTTDLSYSAKSVEKMAYDWLTEVNGRVSRREEYYSA